MRLFHPLRTPRHLVVGMAVGGAFGLLVLHPLTMLVHWYETGAAGLSLPAAGRYLGAWMHEGMSTPMLVMSGLFTLVGAAQGALFAWLAQVTTERARLGTLLERQLHRSLGSLLGEGENADVEFKSSLRWDYRAQRVNRALEDTVTRTIAGFMNRGGGQLLIGVDDTGQVLGLAPDVATLRRGDRDGFQQHLLNLLRERLGADVLPAVHVMFHRSGAQELCRVIVESAGRAVYHTDDRGAHFLLRVGNETRELDARETVQFLRAREAR